MTRDIAHPRHGQGRDSRPGLGNRPMTSVIRGLVLALALAGTAAHASLMPRVTLDFPVQDDDRYAIRVIEEAFGAAADGPQEALEALLAAEQRLKDQQLPPSLLMQLRASICSHQARLDPAGTQARIDAWRAADGESIDIALQAAYRNCEGIVHHEQSDFLAATTAFGEAIELGEAAGKPYIVGASYVLRGWMQVYRGFAEEGLEDLGRGYEAYDAADDENGRGVSLLYMAHAYGSLGQHGTARGYYERLMRRAQAENNRAGLPYIYHGLAGGYAFEGDYEKAREYFLLALEINRERKVDYGIAHITLSLAQTEINLKQPEVAREYAREALEAFTRLGGEDGIARALIRLALIELELQRPAAALAHADDAVSRLEARNVPRSLMEARRVRNLALAALGRWREAYEGMLEFVQLQDDVSVRERNEATERMRVQFDTAQTERENAFLQEQNTIKQEALDAAERARRWQGLAIVLSAVLFLLAAGYGLRQFRRMRVLQSLAMTDELTGLPNRRHILNFAAQSLEWARTHGSELSLMVFDVDHFKRVNDQYGHAVGDLVLKRMAKVSQSALRAGDKVGRTGGEEFLVVLPNANREAALVVGERVRASIEAADFTDIHEWLDPTISVGIAEYAASDRDVTAVIDRADVAQYRAKHGGRNRVEG